MAVNEIPSVKEYYFDRYSCDSIVISTIPATKSKFTKPFFIEGNVYWNENEFFFRKGFILNFSDRELIDKLSIEDASFLKNIEGEFFVIYYNKKKQKMFILNDCLGRERLFYFFREKEIILSDDFWKIVNIIQPDENDIDRQSVKEFVVFRGALFHKTIIKDLNFFPPASFGVYSVVDGTLKIKQYRDLKLKKDSINEKKAVERFHKKLDEIMKEIKEIHGDKIYGLGLSGGLDSRIIPYYALKNGLKLKTFIIGEKRPHKLFLSRDHKIARIIAKYYGLKHEEIEYDSEEIDRKIFYDLRYYPMGAANFLIAVRKGLPKFDILLTGAAGTIINSAAGEKENSLSKEEMMDFIISHQSELGFPVSSFRIALQILLGKKTDAPKRKSIKGIITGEEYQKAAKKIMQFIEKNKDKTNFEIYWKYINYHLTSKSKYGVFESLNGYKPSYTIYYPFLIEETTLWKPDFFKERKILRELIYRKHPKMAEIPNTRVQEPPLIKKRMGKILLRIYFLTDKMIHWIRGIGNWDREKWVRRKNYKKEFTKILLRPNKLFEAMFDVEQIEKQFEQGSISARLYIQIVKVKLLLDAIVYKEYEKFLYSDGWE